jgi:plasmid stability protein
MQATIQHTIRNVPPTLDRLLRRRADISGKSINSTLIDVLQESLAPVVGANYSVYDSVKDIIATASMDDETYAAIAELKKRDKDPEMLQREHSKIMDLGL